MYGYQLTFFTQQDRTHKDRCLGEWLLEEARSLGIKGATLFTAAEGFGRERKLHFVGYFDMSDQPIEVSMAVSDDNAKIFLEHLKREKVNVFYVKSPIEFGRTDDC
ncbi:DUF190 domain-containing protein [Oryzomonas rubra]|uniref:DUF190 domain-containing protein n=1 Tax=Oryzomonas rubra TaxID=2509454 RepID=A0A5A9X6P7_9BACT|nr:DUF190 domain-containing protein [Oryzomonas rubra]KAA0888118.1 DUF190 domain-containing protein [Oryzomonas rubra]